MIIYPSIDVRGGNVVRLKEGDPNRETIFSSGPIATAKKWIDDGATWLHMVNLDGAFANANDNGRILEAIAKLKVNVQFGGGIRRLEDIELAFKRGASRVVLGTIAVENPDSVANALTKWGVEAICVALDARNGKVTTHGWQETTNLTPIGFGRQLAQKGVKHALYTDVQRDGHLIGVNIHETVALGRETGLRVIASGGVSSAEEIHQLARSQVVAGAVIGMALYEGKLTLAEALMAARR
jgi:phosphoribosylformimino-5-aminoimidazole carboxamide ribotide isomerase